MTALLPIAKTSPVTRLSASALSSFHECPMQFYGRYHYGWEWVSPPRTQQALQLGLAVDKALGVFHRGGDPVAELCLLWGSIHVDMPGDYFARALGMIRAYMADEAPDPRDVIQHEFAIRITGVDVPIVGYMDVLRGLVVREIKTTGSKTWWTPERARQSIQTGIYSLATSRANHGAQATVEHHVLSHNTYPECVHTVYSDSLNKADLQVVEESVCETWRQIQEGDLRAACKPGKCRFPTKCAEFGYRGSDSSELVIDDL